MLYQVFTSPARLYAARLVAFVTLYILGGKLGLMLAVPPGYATIIWPAAGIGAGVLILYGWRLFPGVLLGAFILNCHVSDVFAFDTKIDWAVMMRSFCIAAGSTAQAVLAWALVRRFVGLPLMLSGMADMARLLTLAGPVASVTAASFGAFFLWAGGVITPVEMPGTWWRWWLGDVLGVLIFFPLLIILPMRKTYVGWRGTQIGSMPALIIVALAVPLALTFYAWKTSAERAYADGLSQFALITSEIEKNLAHRMDMYSYALLGGAGFFQGSEFVSQAEWQSYTDTIDTTHNFPGISGIGVIFPAKGQKRDRYIITYIEPEKPNKSAIGFDIASEKHRKDAAERARDTGQPTITRRVALVQDTEKKPAFLMFHPIYRHNMPLENTAERRRAFLGWVYAPFIAENFLSPLTESQRDNIHLEVYDGTATKPEHMIYNDDTTEHYTNHDGSQYSQTRTLNILGNTWTLIWRSTEHYDHRHISHTPILILTGGLIFTALFAMFLVVIAVRNTDMLERIAGERNLALPMAVFAVTATAAFGLYSKLEQREVAVTRSAILEEANNIEGLITTQTLDKMTALKRMAQRWSVANGTPEAQWRDDAQNYIGQIPGLEAVMHLNVRGAITLREPRRFSTVPANENRPNKILETHSGQNYPVILGHVITTSRDVTFIPAYAPVTKNNMPDGYLAGILDTTRFFNNMVESRAVGKYAVTIRDGDTTLYRNTHRRNDLVNDWAIERDMRFANRTVRLGIIPVQSFVAAQKTALPFIVLVFGLMIAVLLSMTVRFILISRIRSDYLKSSEETFRTAMDNAPIGMALLDKNGRWLAVNKALCAMVGYADTDLLNLGFAHITPDADDSMERDLIGQLLLGSRDAYQLEKRMIHRDGHILWVLQSVSLARHSDDSVKYFVQQFEDITERKKMDQMKAEFISVVSHELRTPLTSIRGSLGLIEGAFAHDIPERVLSLISLAHKNCERLILLINDILDLDKIAAGKMRFDMRPENLASLVAAGVEANNAYAARYNVTYDVAAVPSELVVRVDANRWHQVFSNLLSNAAKFSPEGSRVTVSCLIMGQTVRVSVRDNGPGISPEFRARIFEKFTQADSTVTRQKGGTGLGLHISKQIIERMNGRIGFDSTMGSGTVFWFDLPIMRDQIANNQNTQPHENTLPRILHIEDDRDLSAVLHSALAGRANLVTATTLRMAEELLGTEPYAMVILDIAMPDGSGLEFLARIHALAGADVPVIILSAHDIARSVEDKVAAVLIKSRVPESRIVDTILAHLPASTTENVA